MKKIINIETWGRRENFNFFKGFLNPTVCVTFNVPCANAFRQAKQNKESFFLHYLHAILLAANAVEEFRYRIDKEDNIVLYDHVDVLAPIKKTNTNTFVTVRIPFCQDRQRFIRQAEEIIGSTTESRPYATEEEATEFDVILVSATPDLPFTSITCTQKNKNGCDYPLINVGKMTDEYALPISIAVHHGFVDGQHITNFYRTLCDTLSE